MANNNEVNMNSKDNIRSIRINKKIWEQLTDKVLEDANCRSKSEFVVEAIKLKLQYDKTKGNQSFLSEEVLSAIDGKLSLFERDMNRSYYGLAFTTMMAIYCLAASGRFTEDDIEKLKRRVEADVKGLNGYVDLGKIVGSMSPKDF